MTTPMRAAALSSLPTLRAAHPQQFRIVTANRVTTLLVLLAGAAVFVLGLWRLEVVPARLVNGIGQFLHVVGLMFPPDPGSPAMLALVLRGMAETLAIAFLGTLAGATIALPFGFLAARNTTIGGIVRFLSRRVFDTIRGVDALIWALIWVGVVGLGPFAGVLAIATSDFGTFGKLFSEAIEAADRKAEEGVLSAGGGPLARIRFGILPQVLPVMAGQVLYLFESNTRSSTIIGIVGAGGIGLHLSEMIRTLEWQAVSFIVLLILVVVAVIDFLSTRLRAAIAGSRKERV
jgi:phosphonate transport system permease protein